MDNTTCANSTQYGITEAIVHELYAEGNVRNDIGILRLNKDVIFNGTIQKFFLDNLAIF
jgi:secreted trypsin-like serine protease